MSVYVAQLYPLQQSLFSLGNDTPYVVRFIRQEQANTLLITKMCGLAHGCLSAAR